MMPRWHFSHSHVVGTSAIVGGLAGLYLYRHIHWALGYDDARVSKTIVASGRQDVEVADIAGSTADLPYPPDVLPGGRCVDTPYGTIKVFEWGPEDGDKVVLLHGIGTPCIALADMAVEFVKRGNRVLLFDFFGRGYSDAPPDVPYDDRLYTSQLFLALSSSPLPWTGHAAFHLVGFSLGGALAASFAAFFPHLLRSVTLVCPGGLVRPYHLDLASRLLYSTGLLPRRLLRWILQKRLEPNDDDDEHGPPSADVPHVVAVEEQNVDFDNVRLITGASVGDVIRWQLRSNQGFTLAYGSTIRNAPIYGELGLWTRLRGVLSERREYSGDVPPPGLPGGKVCLILADKDPVVVASEWVEDVEAVLGQDAVDIRIMNGGHEIAIVRGKEVAEQTMMFWGQDYMQCKLLW